VAACAARGVEVAAGRQRRPSGDRRPHSYHAHGASIRAPARGVAHEVAAACASRGAEVAVGR
jgi:hypothetical protein